MVIFRTFPVLTPCLSSIATPVHSAWFKRILAVMAVLVELSSAAPTFAVMRDHLQCFRIKDEIGAAEYSMDLLTANLLVPPVEPGCTLKMPARLYCIDTATTNVTPPPPGGPVQQPAQAYLCYKAKCNQLKTFFTATDQFGAHDLSLVSTSMICAPVLPLLTCGDGQIECAVGDETVCVDPSNDQWNCGGCGIACPNGNSCVGGNCQQNDCSSLPCEDCTQCAVSPGGACEEEMIAFQNDPQSADFIDCVVNCGGPSCLNMCLQAYPVAGQLYLALAGCVMDACPDCGNSCGNGICEILAGESALTCPSDCSGGVCGDGVCEPGEENSCPGDCHVCGNGLCESGEDAVNCGIDCPPTCGNGICEANEEIECPFDCGAIEASCNNGFDDDGDGLVDCSDPDCSADPACAPGAEVCDGLDNNGDGFIDEGNPGGGVNCHTGMLGVCAQGTTACTDGMLVCPQDVMPSAEVCDGLDNDCDGTTDNDCELCMPVCTGRVCGDDGCGGSCGVCPAGETCNVSNGTCFPEP